MDAYEFAGGTAVVTGAASGIGAALAGLLAARGSNLVLVDRDKERLDGVADGLRRAHPRLAVDTYVVDLSDASATDEAAETLAAAHPGTTLVVNNAGVALGG
ncbi:MAG: SDR family NAD(P)-dependent oxidoreductase, partial [Blastococcus sp.]